MRKNIAVIFFKIAYLEKVVQFISNFGINKIFIYWNILWKF